MHRRFRFCGRIALLGAVTAVPLLALSAFAQDSQDAKSAPNAYASNTQEPAIPLPTPGKHQLKVTPLQMVQHQAEVLAQKLETQGSLLVSLTQQIEEQKKEIEALKEQNESLATNITVLEGQIGNLNDTVEEMNTPSDVNTSAPTAAAASANVVPPKKVKAATVEELRLPDERANGAMDDAGDVPPAGSLTHVVERGENLTSIARKYGTTASDLIKLNRIRDERRLQIGQELLIPADATSTATATSLPSPSTP